MFFALAALLPACAVDIPVPGFLPGTGATGAIKSPAKILSPHLTDDDWTKARPALKAAFAPENAGRAVAWTNGATGFGGSFLAVSLEEGAGNCGAVRFDVSGVPEGGARVGRACKALSGEWVMKESAEG